VTVDSVEGAEERLDGCGVAVRVIGTGKTREGVDPDVGVLFGVAVSRERRKADGKGHSEKERATNHVDDSGSKPGSVRIDDLGVLVLKVDVLRDEGDETVVEEDVVVVKDLVAVLFARPDGCVADESRRGSLCA
jgi:hypothetical protein